MNGLGGAMPLLCTQFALYRGPPNYGAKGPNIGSGGLST